MKLKRWRAAWTVPRVEWAAYVEFRRGLSDRDVRRLAALVRRRRGAVATALAELQRYARELAVPHAELDAFTERMKIAENALRQAAADAQTPRSGRPRTDRGRYVAWLASFGDEGLHAAARAVARRTLVTAGKATDAELQAASAAEPPERTTGQRDLLRAWDREADRQYRAARRVVDKTP